MTVFYAGRVAARTGRAAHLIALALVLSACATRRPELLTPPAPVSGASVWRIEPGDQIRTRIYREPDLSGDAVVGANGTAYFPGLGRVAVVGLSLDSLQVDLAARYGKMVVDAAVDASFQRDIVIYGQIRVPGVYQIDPGTTVLGLVAKAGGASGPGKTPLLTLVKGDGRQFTLPRETRLSQIDITHGDAVFVQDETFLGRNSQNLSAFTILVGAAVTLLSLIFIIAR
jgi:polysaccharide export outer membrane protein